MIFDELNFSKKDFGAHFHSHPDSSYSKIEMAFKSGCNRFDSTINGIGGCPFAKDKLVGNISTQTLLNFIQKNNIQHNVNILNLESSCNDAKDLFKF
jgi:hydroxymethylglutaryl-CoA lyase